MFDIEKDIKKPDICYCDGYFFINVRIWQGARQTRG